MTSLQIFGAFDFFAAYKLKQRGKQCIFLRKAVLTKPALKYLNLFHFTKA